MRVALFDKFMFNDFISPVEGQGQAHIVCVKCYNKYDDPPDLKDRLTAPPAPPDGNEYWYVWLLDHPMVGPIEWAVRHLRRWHPEEVS